MNDLVATLVNFIVTISIMAVFMFVFILLHELGHAFMYRVFSGDNNWHIFMGAGKPMLRF